MYYTYIIIYNIKLYRNEEPQRLPNFHLLWFFVLLKSKRCFIRELFMLIFRFFSYGKFTTWMETQLMKEISGLNLKLHFQMFLSNFLKWDIYNIFFFFFKNEKKTTTWFVRKSRYNEVHKRLTKPSLRFLHICAPWMSKEHVS